MTERMVIFPLRKNQTFLSPVKIIKIVGMNFPENIRLYTIILAILCVLPCQAAAEKEHMGMDGGKVAIEEKLGEDIPLDLPFIDENGSEVKLEQFIDRPTILSLVYYSCQHACPMLLAGQAEVLGKTSIEPGKDFNVLTISFDERDTPARAREKKKNFIKAIGKPFPGKAWHFLTGKKKSIEALTTAVGFQFKKEKEGFTHPVTLIIISPAGKVIRYLTGFTFLPFDIEMGVMEASEGRVGSLVRRAYLYCFSYDPTGKRYAFNILRVVGIVTLLVAISLILFLTLTGRKYRKGPE